MLAFYWLVAAALLLFAYCLSTLFRARAGVQLECGGWENGSTAGRTRPAAPHVAGTDGTDPPPARVCLCSKARVAGGAAAVLYALAMMPG